MLTKRTKKGFTLAELLIVVAIIAVLTAIAVPLFVKGIQDAKDATGAANVRAVRGAAITLLLEDQYDGAETYWANAYKKTNSDEATDYEWTITAKVSSNGEITELNVWEYAKQADAQKVDSEAVKDGYHEVNKTYNIYLVLKQTDLKPGEAA